MPTVGPLRTQPGLDGTGYSSRFDKTTERGGIGFYEVLLKDTGIKAELTATTRAALQRYTFPASDRARVVFDFLLPNEYQMKVLGAKVRRTGPGRNRRRRFKLISRTCSAMATSGLICISSRSSAGRSTRLGGWQWREVVPNAAGACRRR